MVFKGVIIKHTCGDCGRHTETKFQFPIGKDEIRYIKRLSNDIQEMACPICSRSKW